MGKIRLAGINEYSVVVPADSSLTVRTSADILTNAIFRMTGEVLPIEEETGSRKFAILFDAMQMDCDHGYRISAKDGEIVLAGGRRGLSPASLTHGWRELQTSSYGITHDAPTRRSPTSTSSPTM